MVTQHTSGNASWTVIDDSLKAQNQSYVLRLGDTFRLPKVNGRRITGVYKEIYPMLAERLLKTSVGNRVTKSKGRWRLVNDMKRDEYYAHLFDPLRFNTKGQLMDGHHRLIAIVESEVPQIMQCLSGYTKDDMLIMDQSKSRTVADMLKINNKPNFTQRASAISCIYTMINADIIGRQVSKPGNKDANRISEFFTDDMWKSKIQWYQNKVKFTYGLPSGPIIALKLLYDIVNPETSRDFWDGVLFGKDNAYMKKDDPRNALHSKIVRTYRELKKRNSLRKEWPTSDVILWFHYAWMKYESGQPLQQMTSRKNVYDKSWGHLHSVAKEYFTVDFGQNGV